MPASDVTITAVLTHDEAAALAQMFKRIGFSQCRALTETEEEAFLLRDGCDVLAKLLAQAGHAPR